MWAAHWLILQCGGTRPKQVFKTGHNCSAGAAHSVGACGGAVICWAWSAAAQRHRPQAAHVVEVTGQGITRIKGKRGAAAPDAGRPARRWTGEKGGGGRRGKECPPPLLLIPSPPRTGAGTRTGRGGKGPGADPPPVPPPPPPIAPAPRPSGGPSPDGPPSAGSGYVRVHGPIPPARHPFSTRACPGVHPCRPPRGRPPTPPLPCRPRGPGRRPRQTPVPPPLTPLPPAQGRGPDPASTALGLIPHLP